MFIKSLFLKNRKKYLFFILWLSVFVVWNCGCAMRTNRQFSGIDIGDSKDVVFHKLGKGGVREITPAPLEVIVVRKNNIHHLDDIFYSEGIIVEGASLKMYISFSSNTVSDVFLPARFDDKKHNVEVGQSRDSLFLVLKEMLLEDIDLAAYNYIPHGKGISPNTTKEEDINYLTSYDCWKFYEPGGYSDYKLIFENNTLKKIDYNYRPFETP